MNASHRFLAGTLAIAIALAPTAGLAQTADKAATEEASVRYQRGIELYKEENYKAALVEFKKAYELTKSYKVQYNIGQVCYQLQDYVCAVTNFESYLKIGGSEIAEKRRQEVEAELAKLRPRIAEVTFVTNVPGVTITVDDVPYGQTPLPPIRLSAGGHKVVAVKEGKAPLTQSFEVAGADKPTIKLNLVDIGTKEVIVREGAPQSKWTTLSYIGLGVGGALVLAGGVTGFLALSKSSELKNQQFTGETPPDEARSLQSQVRTFRLATDVLLAAGVVTLGTTLALTLSRDTGEKKAAAHKKPVDVSFTFGLGSASLQGVF